VVGFAQGRIQQLEPPLRLGARPAGLGDPLLPFYVPRAPKTGMGPEHLTFTVRQGVP
jgi:hypothetical protein